MHYQHLFFDGTEDQEKSRQPAIPEEQEPPQDPASIHTSTITSNTTRTTSIIVSNEEHITQDAADTAQETTQSVPQLDPPRQFAFHPQLDSFTSDFVMPVLDDDDVQEMRLYAQQQHAAAAEAASLPPWMVVPGPTTPGSQHTLPQSPALYTIASTSSSSTPGGTLARQVNPRTMSVLIMDDKHPAMIAAAANGGLIAPSQAAPPGILLVPQSHQPEKFRDLTSAIKRHKRLFKIYILVFIVLIIILVALALTNQLRMVWFGGINGGIGLLGGGGLNPLFAMHGIGDASLSYGHGQVGACGWAMNDNDVWAALNAYDFGQWAQTSASPMCGACMQITGPTGKTVKVKVVDDCQFCLKGDVELSPVAFHAIGLKGSNNDIAITWTGC